MANWSRRYIRKGEGPMTLLTLSFNREGMETIPVNCNRIRLGLRSYVKLRTDTLLYISFNTF